MVRTLFLFSLLLSSTLVSAANVNCIGAYVGRISVNKTQGLNKIVFLSNPSNSSGSYWVYLNDWEASAKKEALSILLAAKLSMHPVDIYTTASDMCSIGSAGQTLTEIHLSTNP